MISAPDADSIYHVPMMFVKQKLPEIIMKRLKLKKRKPEMKEWTDFANRVNKGTNEVEIAIIGKYTHLIDSYISHEETLRYAGAMRDCKVKIRWIEAPNMEESGNTEELEGVDAVLVPGGFGLSLIHI